MRRGLTLIEMLVALAITLVMMAAVVQLFANISGSIRNRRAMIEVGAHLRQVRQRLSLDLEGATCAGKTWQRPEANAGYIELIEGDWSDTFPGLLVDGEPPTAANRELNYATSTVPSGGSVTTNLTLTNPKLTLRPPADGDVTNGRALGDYDDILALTVRSESEPFKAQVGGTTVESPLAEVVWYAQENPQDDPTTPANEATTGEPGMRRIYRRVFLIAPSQGPWAAGERPQNVSVRLNQTTGQWVANTLGELTKRENRAFREHDATKPEFLFPHPFLQSQLTGDAEYLVLSNALAFDLRVFDPGAPLFDASGAVVQPGDPGWTAVATATGPPAPVGYGAYCDLGWNWDGGAAIYTPTAAALPSRFGEPHHPGWHPRYNAWGGPSTYDTWSFHYENDGVNQDESQIDSVTSTGWRSTLDQGTNGMDDEEIAGTPITYGANGVDDSGERETSPPYDTALRGVKVSLRIYESDARQIRETSVTHSFAN